MSTTVFEVRSHSEKRRRFGFALAMSAVVAGAYGWGNPPVLEAQTSCSDTTVCAAGVFCSGFEEGNKSIWDDWDGNPDSTNLLMTDPGPCNKPSGNRVMRLRVPPGRGGADLVKVLPSSHDKLYARWYQRWEPGFNFSASNHGSGLHAGARELLGHSDYRPTGSDWYTTWFELKPNSGSLNARPYLYTYYRGMYQNCANPSGSCWGDDLPCMFDEGGTFCTKAAHRETVMPPQIQTGRWYCVEMLLDGGTPTSTETGANGTQNFWVDGVQYGPWTNLWHRTTPNLKVNILWLNLFHHDTHSVEGIMMDDVVVSTSRVGCHGTSTPAPPSAPTGLRIIP